jgi:L-ascorbate metabolism protein UlaG (beta-lactamase superfamily)
VTLSELPLIDYVVISHDHYDHLSRKSIQHFVGSNTQFVVPLGLSSYLIGWGLNHNKITEFDWWEEKKAGDITFACTPSQHFSGRLGPKGNKTLWASWVIQGRDERVYFSGDSGYDIHFKEIGKRYGPFDIAFMEDGQYNKIWYMSHLFPNETIQAHEDVQAKKMQPIHFGMFQLAVHDWHEPIYEVLRIAKERNVDVLLPKIGEIVHVNEPLTFDKWYEIP